MKRIFQFLAIFGTLTVIAGCAIVPSPAGNALFSNVDGPLTTSSNGGSSKVGKACANNILGIVASGDATIEAAKKDGGITTVSSVDTETTNVLYLYGRFCTVVRGE